MTADGQSAQFQGGSTTKYASRVVNGCGLRKSVVDGTNFGRLKPSCGYNSTVIDDDDLEELTS